MKKWSLALVLALGVGFAGSVTAAGVCPNDNGFTGVVKDQIGPIPNASVYFVSADSIENAKQKNVAFCQNAVSADEDGSYRFCVLDGCCIGFSEMAKKNYLYLKFASGSMVAVQKITEEQVCKNKNVVINSPEFEGLDLAEVKITGNKNEPSGCRVEMTMAQEDLLKLQKDKNKSWAKFKKDHFVESDRFFINNNQSMWLETTDLATAKKMKIKLEESEFGFSNFLIKDCSDGAASSLTGVSLRPRYQVGVQGTDYLQGDANDLTRWMQRFAKKIAGAMAAIAVFFIVWNAFNMLMAQGDSDTIAKAKKAITWIFWGLLVTIFSYVLIKTIISLTYMH